VPKLRQPTIGRVAEKLISENRRARHDYHFLERLEAGLALQGSEVKSLRQGQASLVDCYARLRGSELWLEGLHIPPYEQGDKRSHQPLRPRKLLLHRREIEPRTRQVWEAFRRLSRDGQGFLDLQHVNELRDQRGPGEGVQDARRRRQAVRRQAGRVHARLEVGLLPVGHQHRRPHTICVAVWHCRIICVAAGMYQLYEPKYSTE